jgi:cell wall assembly regulator SMI1
MNIRKLSKVERPLTGEELQQVETRIGVQLPEDYRLFLLQHNGGHPEPSAFKYTCDQQQWKLAAVAYFLGIYEGEDENFLEYFDDYLGRIPAETIPIARDPGGNLILLGVSEAHRGKVYFWLQDFENDAGDFSNVCFVANSFSEFLNALFDPDA